MLVNTPSRSACLDGGREEHDSGAGTERVGGHVGRELGLDDTRVSVRPRDTSPHHSDLGTGNLPLGLVDVSDTLSEVELSGLLVLNALDLDESGVGSRVPLCSLVTENTSLDVETRRSHFVFCPLVEVT